MTLNLAQTRTLVQSARLTPNPANPAGEAILMSGLYRELKAAGWASTGQTHPIDRVSTLTLNGATIRRDKTQAPGAWLITVAGQDYPFTGSPAEATAEIERLAEPQPAPLSPVQEEAEGLRSEYPELSKRIDSALDLIASGEMAAKFAEYQTEWQNLTRYGNWVCNCSDSTHRQPVAKFGRACKHTLAGEILARAKRTANRITQQKLADLLTRDRARLAATAAGYEAALRPDPINRKASHVYQVGRHLPR